MPGVWLGIERLRLRLRVKRLRYLRLRLRVKRLRYLWLRLRVKRLRYLWCLWHRSAGCLVLLGHLSAADGSMGGVTGTDAGVPTHVVVHWAAATPAATAALRYACGSAWP